MNTKSKLTLGLGFGLLGGAIALAAGVINVNSVFPITASSNDYSITLNSANKQTSSGSAVKKTARGGEVTFNYTDVTSYNAGHTRINAGGTIVNTTQITSISAINATFSGAGTLKARIAYTAETFGEYFTLVSGSRIETGSNPYYIEFKADGGYVNLTSAVITFTCTANPAASPQDTSGSYTITFDATGSDDGTDISNSSDSMKNQVTDGKEYISTITNASKIFAGKHGLKLGSSSNPGNLTINFNSSKVVETITSIDLKTQQYGSDTGNIRAYVNGSTSYSTITPSAGGAVNVNAALTSLEIETTKVRAYLCGLILNYGGTTQPGAPENPDTFEVGFTASDDNKNEYTTNSIFANENALKVYSNKSDSTSTLLSSSEYTYVIRDQYDQPINPNEKFPEIGVYTLVVSYGSYIPQEITLNVGEYVYMTDVAAAMNTVTFNTADTLSNLLAGNLTATIEYSNGVISSSISYADFQENELAVKLLNPKGITSDMSKAFGTPGTWTLKVYDSTNEEMYYNISLTVNAIPVQTITLSESSYSLYPEDELQLVATVNPTNATNDVVEWSSDDEDVATVSDEGLVTAVSAGSATITANAVDGSNVFGSCVVTVVERPTTVDYEIDATSLDQVTTNTEAKVVYTENPVTVTMTKGTDTSTKANNYLGGSGTYTHSRVYNNNIFKIYAGGSPMTKIVIHGMSGYTGGFSNPTWTNASKSTSESDIILTPTTPTSEVSCTNSATARFTGVTVTLGEGSGGSSTPEPVVTDVYPTAISLTGTTSISIGSTSQLSVGYTPSNTTVKNVTFSSANTSVATVSSTGLVTGVAQGTAKITATADAANNTKVTSDLTITVSPISVTSVSLDSSSATVKAGKTITLVATVYPTNATNKAVTWLSNNTSVATVSNSGVVSGISAGEAKITVTTSDGSKTAQCVVTVTAAQAAGEETFSITYTDVPTAYSTGSTIYTASSGIKFQAYNCANYTGKSIQFRASSGYLQNAEDLVLQSITINDRESNTLTVYGSKTAGSFTTEITGTNDVYDLSGYSYFRIARTSSGAAYCSSVTVVTGTPTPTDPTSISLSPTSADVAPGGTKDLSVTYVPSNANQNKNVTWTSSNTNVATVDSNGKVSVKPTATAGQTATITARLTNITSIYATATIRVVEQKKDDHTVLIYMCGSNLESDYASANDGLATGDITEILSVAGQPDDVNIVIETGGAKKWSSEYGISSSNLERWHVENRSLVKDASLTYASMGETSTLQSFIEYGLKNYPAERTGIVFWNHGGAMRGVCYDEKKSDNSLLDTEVKSAVSGALSNSGMSGQKLEWIGYDACLMQVQDIASLNANYFNYMIASEESEAGYGWDYDTWVDDLYAKKTTPTILKAIVDGFIKDNGGVNSSSNDQTLSYLNLSYMPAYKTAWENMSSILYDDKLSDSNKSNFNNLVKSAKHYADSDYTYYGIFDAKDFINKLAANSTFNPGSTYTNAVLSAFANLVEYSSCGKGAGNSNGLCLFWSCSSNCAKGSYYTAAMTEFTTWRSIVVKYGS